MKPLSVVTLAAIIAISGTWAKKKTIEAPQVIGGAVVVLFFVVMQQSQPKLAQQFSWLILATTVGAYGDDLFGTLGHLTTGKAKDDSAQVGSK